ncbi:MAG TPA: PaREP1 family protein [Candidatus Brocadiia bacterium]|nr:PaREP1 family protein [Candidatus Brocadiales bacterium]
MQINGKVKRYLELNSKCISDAEECLRKGDYAQASEKLWGATVTIMKAVAAQRKKTIKTHDGISYFFAQIAKELSDESINGVFLIAEGLHQNFYENSAHPDIVKKGAKTVKQFVTRVKSKFEGLTFHQSL